MGSINTEPAEKELIISDAITTEPDGLTPHQERRALAVERAAWSLTGQVPGKFPDPEDVMTLAEYVITGTRHIPAG